ncbi:MAG: hypothetical protein KDD70_04845 [Bdellovibrionales bacterium]|nr:hypothetical protein [Bdellovibrionales bacterium]
MSMVTLVVLSHRFLMPELPQVQSAFEIWLAQLEDDLLHGKNRQVEVRVALHTKDLDRKWLLKEPSDQASDRPLMLRVLGLIRAGGLLDRRPGSEEHVMVEINGEAFQSTSLVPWSELATNLPAQNLFVLLEAAQPLSVTPVAVERGKEDENQG